MVRCIRFVGFSDFYFVFTGLRLDSIRSLFQDTFYGKSCDLFLGQGKSQGD